MSARPYPSAGVAAALAPARTPRGGPADRPAPAHVARTHVIRVDAPLDAAFPLFEPVGEKSWAAGWDPEFLYPAGGEAREGGVFLTRAAGEPDTVWMVARHRPEEGLVAYARITPGLRAVRVEVRCAPDGPGATRVTVTYEYTPLAKGPDPYLQGLAEEAYREGIEAWGRAIAHYLRHGTAPGDA